MRPNNYPHAQKSPFNRLKITCKTAQQSNSPAYVTPPKPLFLNSLQDIFYKKQENSGQFLCLSFLTHHTLVIKLKGGGGGEEECRLQSFFGSEKSPFASACSTF